MRKRWPCSDSISAIDKRLNSELKTGDDSTALDSQTMVSRALDLMMTGNAAVQAILANRKKKLQEQAAVKKDTKALVALSQLYTRVTSLVSALNTQLENRRDRMAAKLVEERVALSKGSTKELSQLLYAARAAAALHLARATAAAADVEAISEQLRKHDQLFGDLAPRRRDGVETMRQEMKLVLACVCVWGGGGGRRPLRCSTQPCSLTHLSAVCLLVLGDPDGAAV